MLMSKTEPGTISKRDYHESLAKVLRCWSDEDVESDDLRKALFDACLTTLGSFFSASAAPPSDPISMLDLWTDEFIEANQTPDLELLSCLEELELVTKKMVEDLRQSTDYAHTTRITANLR